MDSATIVRQFYRKYGVGGLESNTTPKKTEDLIKVVVRLLPKDGRVLDVGCGYGRIAIPIAQLGYNIEGIDLAPNFIKEAKRRAKAEKVGVRFRVGDMRKLPYASNTFDVVLLLWSSFTELLKEKDQIRALKEVYRILKPGGLGFIEVRNGEQKNMRALLAGSRYSREERLMHWKLNGFDTMDYLHDRKSLREICHSAGMKKFKVQIKKIGGIQRIVVYLHK